MLYTVSIFKRKHYYSVAPADIFPTVVLAMAGNVFRYYRQMKKLSIPTRAVSKLRSVC